MASLFIKLYLDEDVNVLVADLLRARGFNVVTTVEAGNLNHNDDQQLDYAVSSQMALFTHNRADFEVRALEYFAAGKTHYGIIIGTRRSPYELAQRLLRILNQTTADEMINQVQYI